MKTGHISTFDPEVGLGTARGDDGREFPFHCTAIADGSREIEPGERVAFIVVAGHRGRWEAAEITRI